MNKRLTGFFRIILAVAAINASGCGGGGGSVEVAGLPRATVKATSPVNGQTAVPVNSLITARFSKEMQASSFTPSTFYATSPAGPLTGVVNYDSATLTATLQLESPMPQLTVITATLSPGIMDNPDSARPGHLGINAYVWTFTTGTNDVPPVVGSTVPIAGAVGVSPSTIVSATFNKAMNAASLTTTSFTLVPGAGPSRRPQSSVPATITYANDTATLTPTTKLANDTVYTATVTTAAVDLAGTALSKNYSWSFTTALADVAPKVVSVLPASLATGVSISTKVSATFSEAMNAATINSTNFTLKGPNGTTLPATVTYSNDVAVLDPTAPLLGSTTYTATVFNAVQDVAGTPLASTYTWVFTTASTDIAPRIETTVPAATATGVSQSTNVTVTFSEAMKASSITTATVTLAGPNGVNLPATVTYANDVATLSPTAALAGSTIYTATVTTGVQDVAGTALQSPYTWTFTTKPTDIAPTVISTIPAALATGVLANATVSATFSEAMMASSLTTSTFTLVDPGGNIVPATISYANNVATLTPTGLLTGAITYTATVTTGAKDVAGTAMVANKVWTFKTDVPPTITAVTPPNNATQVLFGTVVTATFSEAMNPLSITGTTFNLMGPGGVNVPATISYANDVATLTPTSMLAAGTTYTATVTTGVKDVAGTSLAANKVWTFKTDVPPTITAISPANGATQVAVVDSVLATFSENMSPGTINGTTFQLTGPGGVIVPATVSYSNDVATLAPTSALAGTTLYTATVTTGVKDVAGTPLAVSKTWSFTTGQPGINLASARTYGILAGSTVTNGGPTNIVGNIGVSPGTAVTGFPPGTLTGVINAGNPAAAQAKADLLAGYTDAASRLNGNALPGSIGGLTFTPGLYTNATSVLLPVGASVTFDARGDANAVFILQMGSTLTTGVGSSVILIGGAKPGNIYWSVGSSATLGVNSTFGGIILASASITANTGASINGLLLTNIAAITLQSNSVTVPPPSKQKKAPPTQRKK